MFVYLLNVCPFKGEFELEGDIIDVSDVWQSPHFLFLLGV